MTAALAWLRTATTRQGPQPPGDPWEELCRELLDALHWPEWPRVWLTLAHDAERLGLLDRPRRVLTEALYLEELPAYVGTDPRVQARPSWVSVDGLLVARAGVGRVYLRPPALARLEREA